MSTYQVAMKSLENQVGQISQLLNTRPMGGFPSDTEVAKVPTHEQCKAISTRSGRILNTPIKNKQGEEVAANPSTKAILYNPAKADTSAEAEEHHENPPKPKETYSTLAAPHIKLPKTDKLEDMRPPLPFPQRLKKQKQEYQFKKFFDILKQVHINQPLVEVLQQLLNYAKFLKDMLSRKRQIREFEIATANEACLALIHNKVPTKRTDPGSSTIPCSIGTIIQAKPYVTLVPALI
ncbi:hypothetical protein GQ457_13G017390 [Hibiscus cannabinus]